MSLDVAGLLTDTDADTDTATVNRVETFEFRLALLDLSSPHYDLSGTYRVHMHQSEPCLGGKPFLQACVP